MDLITDLRELALATRLKRLSDRLMKDVSQVYLDLGVDFRANWFTILYALGRQSPMAVTEIARMLGQSHPAINQIAAQLLARGLITQAKDPGDERKRLLRLSPRGRGLIKDLEPVWRDIRLANQALLKEAGVDLIGDIARVEAALDRDSMSNRVNRRLGLPTTPRLTIVDYRPAYKKHFMALNMEWLQKYFTVEESDLKILSDPSRRIIKKGGAILFAILDGEIVGTCALVRHDGDIIELAKMAVTERAQGQGVGRALAEAAIARAAEMGAVRLYLHTSPVLKRACRLYRKLGFRKIRRSPVPGDEARRYRRCSIGMVRSIGQER
jgi:N-acetylglutamate synthase-like GNAT family acetyltransferase/DNA-binding MarR family transcriptional regulator